MNPLVLGVLVVAAAYVVVSSVVSLLVAGAAAAGERPGIAASPKRASALFTLALAPSVLGLLAVLGVALPAWVRHEPRGGSPEEPGPVVLMLGAAGLALLVLRLGSALREQLRTERLASRWIGAGRDLPGLPLPATRVPCDFPLAAVFGLWRPRLLLSESLLAGLDESEVRAVVEHEVAHVQVRENLRRLLLRASPDLLALLPAGARLRAQFDEASEVAADHAASARVPPVLLARALVKVAKLVAPGQRLELSFAAFHRDHGIAGRVATLLRAAGRGSEGGEGAGGGRLGVKVAAASGVALLLAAGQAASPAVHRLLEDLVHLFA